MTGGSRVDLRAPGRWLRSVAPRRGDVRTDVTVGLPIALSQVPSGMAAATLAGVSPAHGLYAGIAGTITGGLTASTELMVISTTNASALAAGSALALVAPGDRGDALLVLTLVAGIAMLIAGIAKLGRLTAFVSHSVMRGFLAGVGVNIICGQLPKLAGATVTGRLPVERAADLLRHPSSIDGPSLAVGLLAVAILELARRRRFATVGALAALVVPTIATIAAGWDSVARVHDAGAIPTGLPSPGLPDLGLLDLNLLLAGLAVAVIVVIQSAGVAEACPNRGGRTSSDGDFRGLGWANLASSMYHGQPVGGAVSQSAMNRASGSRGRWSTIWSGLWMIPILLLFADLVGKVATPTLAAVLLVAAVGALSPGELITTFRTGPNAKIAMTTTFIATLLLSVTAAVGIGVALSLLLQVNREAMDVAIVRLVRQPDGRIAEVPPPARLASREVCALDVYGSLFYAGARTLQLRLPDPTGSERPAVVLRLRGRTAMGSTCLKVLAGYALRLDAVGGRLFLSGVDPELAGQLRATGFLTAAHPVEWVEATEIVGESTNVAADRAADWLAAGDAPTG